MITLKSEVKRQWLEDLRSGKIPQLERFLYEPSTGAMCCLGVLSNLYIKETGEAYWDQDCLASRKDGNAKSWPHVAVANWASVTGRADYESTLSDDSYTLPFLDRNECPQSLATLNDEGFTFAQIADVIEYFM